MTGRKPIGTSFEDWIERQVREATERGDFDDLPGAGAPLRGLDRDFSAEQWAADKARREGFDVTAMLPPALALRREREVLARDVHELVSEAAVRAVAGDFNDRVHELYRRPADGPLIVVPLLDADVLVEQWRARRPTPAPAAPTPAPRRRWWRRHAR
ncbi:DnaJ family domain-containing protein [Kineococcus sp. SYSU DK003]|uniref:DnaJ family domain-containing protein n=1 Tax=Kineococcus sp. SYSU DK003 TaxID=3383124 RepID=UPI003D7F114B